MDSSKALQFRFVRTDKNEQTRGDRTMEEHPLKAKSRGTVPGYKDPQLLEGGLKTNSPTMTAEATAILLQWAASEGWDLQQGDVDSAFLNGRYLSGDRIVYFKAPKGDCRRYRSLVGSTSPPGRYCVRRRASTA